MHVRINQARDDPQPTEVFCIARQLGAWAQLRDPALFDDYSVKPRVEDRLAVEYAYTFEIHAPE
jgi:hypothetical protein